MEAARSTGSEEQRREGPAGGGGTQQRPAAERLGLAFRGKRGGSDKEDEVEGSAGGRRRGSSCRVGADGDGSGEEEKKGSGADRKSVV